MSRKFYVTRAHTANRVHEHDGGPCCTFQGHDLEKGEDIYFCTEEKGTLIRRFGSDGPDYHAMPLDLIKRVRATQPEHVKDWGAALSTFD